MTELKMGAKMKPRKKGLLTEDKGSKKIMEGLEKKALVPNYNNSSTFGIGDCLSDGREANSPIVFDDDDELFINKNNPTSKDKTLGGYNWEEYGFHITCRP